MDNNNLKVLSDFISQNSRELSSFHPINRQFLEPYVKDLLVMQPKELLFYNLETKAPLYSVYFMLSLPEVWERITVDDLREMFESFESIFSFQSLIEFTYKYIEIDIIPLVLISENFKKRFQGDMIIIMKNLYINYFKDEGDFLFFEKGLIGVTLKQWGYIKQLFLLDGRIRPAVKSQQYFEESLPEIFS